MSGVAVGESGSRAKDSVTGSHPWKTAEIVSIIVTGYACFLYYNLIGHISSLRGLDFGPFLYTPLDRAFPYIPELVWFYQIAVPVPALTLALISWKIGRDVPVYRRVVLAFLTLLFFQFALYLLLPTSGTSVRLAEAATGEGLLGALVRYQYRLASLWCACPSLHVSACWYFYRLFARYYPHLRFLYLFWFIGMVLGTVGIKIHYVLDGVAGLVLGEAAYRFVLLRLERTRALEWRWSANRFGRLVLLAVPLALLAGIPLLMWATGRDWPLYTLVPAD